jgi:hypothetical protein
MSTQRKEVIVGPNRGNVQMKLEEPERDPKKLAGSLETEIASRRCCHTLTESLPTDIIGTKGTVMWTRGVAELATKLCRRKD